MILVPAMDGVMSLKKIAGSDISLASGMSYQAEASYRLANDMWQVKHLKGLTFVSEIISKVVPR